MTISPFKPTVLNSTTPDYDPLLNPEPIAQPTNPSTEPSPALIPDPITQPTASIAEPVSAVDFDPEDQDYEAYSALIERQYQEEVTAKGADAADEPSLDEADYLEPHFSDEDVMAAASSFEAEQEEDWSAEASPELEAIAAFDETVPELEPDAAAEESSEFSEFASQPDTAGEWGEYSSAASTAEESFYPVESSNQLEPDFDSYEPEPVALETEMEPANPVLSAFTEPTSTPPQATSDLDELPLNEFASEPVEELLEEFSDPRTAKSKVLISANPFAKAAVVGIGVLIGVLFLGAVYSALTAGSKRSSSLEKLEASPSPTESAAPQESGKLKSELAFASQLNDMDKARRIQGANASSTPTPIARLMPSPTSASSTPIVRSVPLPPAPTPVTAPAPIASAPVSAPVSAPIQPLIVPTSVDPYASLSPVERWQQIATSGSFGHLNPSAVRPAQAPTPATPAASVQPYTPPVAATQTGGGTLAALRASSTTPGLRTAPLADVLVGTSSSGAMITAIVLSEDNSQAVNPSDPGATKYLVSLTRAIKDAKGQTAIPAGATLVAVVSGFSPGSGMMQLAVKGVLVNNQEYAAPDGVLVIRGTNGGSLQAHRVGGSNAIIETLLPAVMGGISQAGSQLTQNQGTTTTNGNVTTTTSSGGSNPTAGFMQGFSGTLSTQLQTAAQAANQANQSRPKSWQLRSGEAVQVFVNSTFQM